MKTVEWYRSAVQTANAYKLISGFEDGNFRLVKSVHTLIHIY
ncbi:S-layer homology domain-containing protein [Cohnella sp.]